MRSRLGGRLLSSQCPPVAPIAQPAVVIRGPTAQPPSIASRSTTSWKSADPTLRTEVKPASSVFLALATPTALQKLSVYCRPR